MATRPKARRSEAREDGRRRQDEILDAALAVFAARGPMRTSVDEIRLKAGASPSSIYHHFAGGLEAITLGVLERIFAREFTYLAQRVTTTTSARECVETLVQAHVEWVLAHRKEARVMYQLMSLELSPKVSVPLAKSKAALLEPVVAHFAKFIANGALPAWDPLMFDVVLLGVAHESCRRFLAGAPLDEKWLREELPALAWRSLPSPQRKAARR